MPKNDDSRQRASSAGKRRQKIASANSIIDAALAVADRDGMHGVTIRAVAKAAGISPMALYTYFTHKQDLYDAMFASVIERAFERVGHPTWQLELEAGCKQARALLCAHPEWLPLLTRVAVPAASLPFYEHLLELTSADGISPNDTMLATSSAISFTLGSVLVERMMTRADDTAVPVAQLRLIKDRVRSTAVAKWPRIASTAAIFDGWSFDAVFEHGVRSLVAGIEQRAREKKAVQTA